MPLTQAEKDRLKYLQDKHSPKEPVNSAEGSYNPSVPTNYPAVPYKAPPELTWDQQLGNVANAVARGLEPYAAAAGAGAAVGSIGGGVGAIPGALVGAGTLALGDLGAFGYNAIAPMFNGQRITSPSDLLRQGTDTVGLTKVPDDPLSRTAYTAADFAGGSVGGAPLVRGAGQLISKAPGAIGAVGNFLRQETPNAVLAGSGLLGGAVTQGAVELGAPDQIAIPLGIAASLKGGKYAERLAGMTPPTPRAYTSRQLKENSGESYRESHETDVTIPAAYVDNMFKKAIRDAINPKHPEGAIASSGAKHPPLVAVLKKYRDLAEKEGRLTSRNLETLRKELWTASAKTGQEPQIITRRVRESIDRQTAQPSMTTDALRDALAAVKSKGPPASPIRARQNMDFNDPDMISVASGARAARVKAADALQAAKEAGSARAALESRRPALAAEVDRLLKAGGDWVPANKKLTALDAEIKKNTQREIFAQQEVKKSAAASKKADDERSAVEEELAPSNRPPSAVPNVTKRNEALARARESAGTGFRTASLEAAVGGTKDELRRAARAFVNRPDFNQVPTVTQDLALELARMPNGRGGTIKTATDLAAMAARVAAPGALSIPIEVAAQTTKKLVAGASQNKATRQFLNLIDQVSRGRNATIPSQPEAQKAANYVLTTISPSGRIDERRKEDEKRKSDRLAKILAQ